MSLPGLPAAPGVAVGHLRGVDSLSSPDTGTAPILVVELDEGPTPRFEDSVQGLILTGPTPNRRIALPAVAGIDRDVLREGEMARIDGNSGMLALDGTREVPVVTAFLQRPDGRVLLLLRSARVGSFQGRWAGVSGYLEGRAPLEQALREIEEETGITPPEVALASEGRPVLAREGSTIYIVHPFRFRTADRALRLDWEHVRAEWVDPSEIDRRVTVPKLDRAWRAVAGADPPKP
jgi:8-oxo-dGTP diphosphatase